LIRGGQFRDWWSTQFLRILHRSRFAVFACGWLIFGFAEISKPDRPMLYMKGNMLITEAALKALDAAIPH
jgi:hypothetical protein